MPIVLNPKKISLGKRHRKDLGNLAELARSIDEVGLLHPIVITPANRLIAGERRLRAWQLSRYRHEPIPVRVFDLEKIARGEYDENAIRKDFTPTEIVSIKRDLEPLLKAEAKARQADRGRTAKKEDKGKAADKLGAIVGRDRKTIAKAEAIVKAHENDPGDKRIAKLVEDMNRTGRVDGPFKRLQVMRQAAAIKASPPGLPMKGPYHVVAIDFPWPHEPGMSQEDIDRRGRSLRPYAPMSIKRGLTFMREQVRPILKKDAVVYFWVTNFHMPFAFELLEALGIKQHSTIATWAKDKIGRGQVLRDQTEHCIIACRGEPVINLAGMSPQATTLWRGVGWERRANSQKPAAFYELVQRLTPAPRYAEIFSCSTLGSLWDAHGDEVGKHAPITPALPFAEGLGEQDPPPPASLAADPPQAALPAAADDAQLDIPAFLDRRGEAERTSSLVNPRLLPSQKTIKAIADRAEGDAA